MPAIISFSPGFFTPVTSQPASPAARRTTSASAATRPAPDFSIAQAAAATIGLVANGCMQVREKDA